MLELELIRLHTGIEQVVPCTGEHLDVAQREPEPMDVAVHAPGAFVRVGADVPVASNHAAEVSAAIVGRMERGGGELTDAHQLAVQCQMWPLPMLQIGNVFPAAAREEAVIAAGDELGAVLQDHPVRRLEGRPPIKHLGDGEAPIHTLAHRPVDGVAGLDVGEHLRPPIRHEDLGVAADAVNARMTASPVRIDRPAERHARRLGHLVQGRLRPHFVEPHLEGLGRVEAAYHRRVAVARKLMLVFALDPEVVPAHERMFAQRPDDC